MASNSKSYSAPKVYGAWVGGTYFQPGQSLPPGTTEFRVSAVENITGTHHGWRTVHEIFAVGTSFDDIDDEMYQLFSDLAEEYGVPFGG